MIWYNIIYAKKQFARWQRPDQSKWSNGFSVDTGSVCPCEPHHLPKSSTMNRNQQQIHIKCLVHLNPFTITTQHSYRASTIMLSPFTVMFTGIWCGIRGDTHWSIRLITAKNSDTKSELCVAGQRGHPTTGITWEKWNTWNEFVLVYCCCCCCCCCRSYCSCCGSSFFVWFPNSLE